MNWRAMPEVHGQLCWHGRLLSLPRECQPGTWCQNLCKDESSRAWFTPTLQATDPPLLCAVDLPSYNPSNPWAKTWADDVSYGARNPLACATR